MAIPIEFVSVMLLKSAVEKKYPGGVDGFAAQELSNFLEDEHLVRVAFMSGRDAFDFVESQEQWGLSYSDDARTDMAGVTWLDPSGPAWLAVGECEGCGACWHSEHPPGVLSQPDPDMLVRIDRFATRDELIALLRSAGIETGECPSTLDGGTIALECRRSQGFICLELITDPVSDRPVGLWGRRKFTRRAWVEQDRNLWYAVQKLAESDEPPG